MDHVHEIDYVFRGREEMVEERTNLAPRLVGKGAVYMLAPCEIFPAALDFTPISACRQPVRVVSIAGVGI